MAENLSIRWMMLSRDVSPMSMVSPYKIEAYWVPRFDIYSRKKEKVEEF
jgi:hypothetical protein